MRRIKGGGTAPSPKITRFSADKAQISFGGVTGTVRKVRIGSDVSYEAWLGKRRPSKPSATKSADTLAEIREWFVDQVEERAAQGKSTTRTQRPKPVGAGQRALVGLASGSGGSQTGTRTTGTRRLAQ